ncbi:MAG TPA: hypothetical protein VFA38_03460 [Nitrospirales bacterium]|nr:hypothetical protein [Nitrospirales bacterium]
MTTKICMRAVPALLLAAVLIIVGDADAARKKSRPVVAPDLKILSVGVAPDPYDVGDGPLDFHVEIELPDETAPGTLLDVSALIASPSRRSMRFLANREPVDARVFSKTAADGKRHVAVVLSWDGTDQSRRVVTAGRFSYEIRAKLLTNGDRGPHTQMTSWPKRGTVDVRNRLGPNGP